MKISEICINRPVLAMVINLMLVLIGYICFDRISVREYPNIDEPVVTVNTTYSGASPEIMESQVTTPLEDVLSGIEGINYLTSFSRSESSQITVGFVAGVDPDDAANNVRDRVARVRRKLPKDILDPVVAKVEADAQPIIWLSLYSDKLNDLEVSDVADRLVRDRLQNIQGISSINFVGERRYAMRIWLNPAKMAGHGVTAADIEAAIRQQNVEIPAGRVESAQREFTILSQTDLKTPEEFGEIIIKSLPTGVIKLRDVAVVELGAEDYRKFARFKGMKAVGIGIVKHATANPLLVSNAVKKLIPEIQKALPEHMTLDVSYDTSVFVDASIHAAIKTFFEAVLLVTVVIFLFLRNMRASIIPLVTIPISVVVTFAIMYYLNFTINTLTLLALVLAIGLVVDDAIVVLENSYRHIENGLSTKDAAFKAMNEIGFAVVAMTLTLAAVYAPVALSPGKTGKLFTEFAVTLAGAVIVSGITALTLTPMMCARFLKANKKHEHSDKKSIFHKMESSYTLILRGVLNWKYLTALSAIIFSGIGYYYVTLLKNELSPLEDRGAIVGQIQAPEGASPEYVDKFTHQVEDIYANTPEIDRYFAVVGYNSSYPSIQFGVLKDWHERTKTQMQLVEELKPKFAKLTGVNAFPQNRPSLGQSVVAKPVNFVLQTNGSYADLSKMVSQMLDAAKSNPGLVNPDSDLKMNKPELKLEINREKAAEFGIPLDTIGQTIETMFGGREVTRFKRDGKQYLVMVQLEDKFRANPDDINNIYLRAAGGQMISLSSLVTIHESVAPRELNHLNKLRSARITANLAPNYSLGDALAFLKEKAGTITPPPVSTALDGISRDFGQSGKSVIITLALALAFIYMVLAAQFESFVTPFIIMLSVPLAFAGAAITLYYSGGSNNIYSQVGMITLIGLITKNGILIVEFANQIKAQGGHYKDAVIESARLRLRPILMTTICTVLGAVPLVLASGAGSETRMQIGWVIVGGMSIGTLFTLFIIPAFYVIVNGIRKQK